MPGRIDACRCGATRENAALDAGPARPAAPASPVRPADPVRPALGAAGFAVRIAIAIVVFGAAGAGWYVWTKDAAKEQQAAMARTKDAVARRVSQKNTIELREAESLSHGRGAAPPAAPLQPGVTAAQTPAASAEPVPLEDLVARVAPAVVLIQSSSGRGTGFFVEPDTLITNEHVVRADISVRIRTMSGEVLNARVERAAPDLDLAVLKIPQPADNQTVLPMGAVGRVHTGEDVIAIGSPLGTLQNSVTRGIVSAVRQVDNLTMIQTDAAINPGNSGGPLIDRSGTVIGINSYGNATAHGIAFALAVDHARDLMSGQHVANTVRTPLAALNDGPSATSRSDAEVTRTSAKQRYDQALAKLARQADTIDEDWRRFRRDCYNGTISARFDREWFALYDPKLVQGLVNYGCGGFFADLRTEAYTVKNTVEALDEEARKADVFPGDRRQLRQKYHLDWDR